MSTQIHASLEAPKPRAHGIRVLLVDDHAVVRSGLAESLSAIHDLEVAGEAAGGEEALVRCAALKPDVVLMDLVMPGMDGITATRLIRAKLPEVQVIGLFSFEQDHLLEAALEAGVFRCMVNTVTGDELAAAIREANAERQMLESESAGEGSAGTVRVSELPALTTRQQQVLELMVSGMGNAEIADQLAISLSAVKYHVRNILELLEVESRAAAVSAALQKHLV